MMTLMKHAVAISALLLTSVSFAAEKPSIWVYSDLSDPRDVRQHNHPQNDPDDISALGALLLSANRFHIEGIVIASTNRSQLKDPMPFIQEGFIKPYEQSVPGLNKVIGGYQPTINIMRSDNAQNGEPRRFNPSQNYSDLSTNKTVEALVNLLNKKPIFVLSWGPSTESAILVKHLLDTKNQQALDNLTVVSHWTVSTIAQGTAEKPFHVANCRDDWKACMYLHDLAKASKVKFIELGSTGQTGVVDGSSQFKHYPVFENSPLGQMFYHSKFVNHKPDQSDSATFWLLTEFGPSLEDVSTDGILTTETEKKLRDQFVQDGTALIEDLATRSNAAAQSAAPLSRDTIANFFTYIFFKKGKIEVYCPYDSQLQLTDKEQNVLLNETLKSGDHTFMKPEWKAPIQAKFTCENEIKTFTFNDLNK